MAVLESRGTPEVLTGTTLMSAQKLPRPCLSLVGLALLYTFLYTITESVMLVGCGLNNDYQVQIAYA